MRYSCPLLLATVLVPVHAEARQAAEPARWEIQLGLGLRGSGTGGSVDGVLPAPAGTFVVNSVSSGRFVPSWFFGDGALILNANNATNSSGAGIIPIDALLTEGSGRPGRGLSFNVRATRGLTRRLAFEAVLEFSPTGISWSEAAEANLQQAATSFRNAVNQALATVSQIRTVEASTQTSTSGTQALVGGEIRIQLAPDADWGPHVSAGVGMLLRSGASATADLTGQYTFTSSSSRIVFSEADRVSIVVTEKNAAFVRFGGGVVRSLGQRIGLRGDVSLMVSPSRQETIVTATPQSGSGTQAGVSHALGLANTIRFSTQTGTASSLSVGLDEFRTFEGSGWPRQAAVSGGIYFKF